TLVRLWAHIQCLNAVSQQESVADTVVASDQHFHLARPLPSRPNVFVYVLVSGKKVRLADARLHLALAVGAIGAPVVEAQPVTTETELETLLQATDDE